MFKKDQILIIRDISPHPKTGRPPGFTNSDTGVYYNYKVGDKFIFNRLERGLEETCAIVIPLEFPFNTVPIRIERFFSKLCKYRKKK